MARDGEIDRREAILDAALHLFADLGFHGTSVPQVAERAGVGAGTIYRYFEGKEALVNAVFQREKEKIGKVLIADAAIHKPWREQFRAFWRRLIEYGRSSPASFDFLELHHHGPYLDAKSLEIEEIVLGAARAFFVETERQQVTKPVPPDLLIAIVWGTFAAVVKASRGHTLELDENTINLAENCVWEAIRR
jgi:AcrR family transcriptional regulator